MTRIVRATRNNIQLAAEIARKGGLVVYPTDTVYGLGCDPSNSNALQRILRVKGSEARPLPILASKLDDVERVAELTERARIISDRFWPGPLTLVLRKKPLAEVVTFCSENIGIRIPNNQVALCLARMSGGLIVGTSANKTGAKPPCTAIDAYRQLGGNVDVFLDGGEVELCASSTVLDLTRDEPTILRNGPIKIGDVLVAIE
ncbi:MAG: threonylcarbamoyl-AMP synthase [Candidatus Bathyarchaeota archaeon]|nr:MAG: threonylcarbamoyl-AMP synthase [Candidatus Bathyarchaeota archaeon]